MKRAEKISNKDIPEVGVNDGGNKNERQHENEINDNSSRVEEVHVVGVKVLMVIRKMR